MKDDIYGVRVLWIDPNGSMVAAGFIRGHDKSAGKVMLEWELQAPRVERAVKAWVEVKDVHVPTTIPFLERYPD